LTKPVNKIALAVAAEPRNKYAVAAQGIVTTNRLEGELCTPDASALST
jgi:hypothetical protein